MSSPQKQSPIISRASGETTTKKPFCVPKGNFRLQFNIFHWDIENFPRQFFTSRSLVYFSKKVATAFQMIRRSPISRSPRQNWLASESGPAIGNFSNYEKTKIDLGFPFVTKMKKVWKLRIKLNSFLKLFLKRRQHETIDLRTATKTTFSWPLRNNFHKSKTLAIQLFHVPHFLQSFMFCNK